MLFVTSCKVLNTVLRSGSIFATAKAVNLREEQRKTFKIANCKPGCENMGKSFLEIA